MGSRGDDGQAAAGFRDADKLLNTEDLKHALDITVNLGRAPSDKGTEGVYRLFEVPFHCKQVLWDDWLANTRNETFQELLRSDGFREAHRLLVRSLDMNGDGKITPMDFQLMYDTKLTPTLTRNQATLDLWLPFIGQCAFGLCVGLGVGALARRVYRGKYWIAGGGFLGYSALQYLAQQNFVNQKVLEDAFREKVHQLADVDGNGEVTREDVNALVENRMRFISTKLGPDGLAPGAAGYASLALGFARGVRFI